MGNKKGARDDIGMIFVPPISLNSQFLALPFIISCYKQKEINTRAVSSVGRASRLHPVRPVSPKC